MSKKIAVTTTSFAVHSSEPLDLLRRAGFEAVTNPLGRVLTAEETVSFLCGLEGVVAGTEPMRREVLSALPELKVISRVGVGLDNVDLAFARERGITVLNTPNGPTRAVAELAVGLALDLLRQVSHMDRELRGGVWKKRMGRLLLGKRVGVVGMGRIGQATADLFGALGTAVAYADPCTAPDNHTRMDLTDLLGWADIVTMHCSNPDCQGYLIGPAELDAMRPGAYLINLARGNILDEAALAERLSDGRLAGAALDVFGKEPYQGPLADLDNVVLTPHIGSYGLEGRIKMEVDAVENLLRALGAGS
jgi:D-3-phosphoglycerate dehydrogenase